MSRAQRLGAARRCRKEINHALGPAPRRPLALTDRIQISDPAAQRVILDGRRIHVPHPAAYRILARLIEAGGDMVSCGEIQKLPGCKRKKIDRIIREHFPPLVRQLIKSKRGAGGGRWLELPPSESAGRSPMGPNGP